MENPTHIFRFGRYKVGINKFLVSIKISLFCWFAAARTAETFISIYLKHQGLTITHLSLMITVGVVFQFTASITSGMFADRIGRVKPFLFMYGSIFLVALQCFIAMPKIEGCDTKTISFHCVDQNYTSQDFCQISHDAAGKDSCSIACSGNGTHSDGNGNCASVSLLLQRDDKFTSQDSCQISLDTFGKDSCSITCSGNAMHSNEYRNCTSVSLLLEGDFFDELYHGNETSSICLYPVNFRNYSSEGIPLCELQNCKTFGLICSEKEPSLDCLRNRSFWILVYGMLFVLYNTSRTIIYRFFDVIVMDLINQYNSDFGSQRVWSILGQSIGPLVAGYLSHKMAANERDKNYTPVFVCSTVFTLLAFIPVWKVNPKFHKPATMVWKKSLEFATNLESILFFALQLTMGTCFGFITIYGNWYLQDLGASDLLLGVSTTVYALCGLPFTYWAKWFIDKAGLRNFFVICLLSYVFHSFAFSVMREPWIAVGILLLSAVSYNGFWVASIQYCDEVAPVELQATIKGVAGTLHYNIDYCETKLCIKQNVVEKEERLLS